MAGRPLRFTHLGTEEGLPSETVTSVLRDRDGLTWFGTRDGLALYDGTGVRVFEHVAGDPASLPDNTVRTLYQDRAGVLWLGTNLGGLARLDPATWRFKTYPHVAGDPTSLSHASVYAILEDRSGGLWVATQEGLNRLDRATGRFDRFPAGGPRGPPHDYVTSLHEDGAGRLWTATFGGGLGMRDPDSGDFTAFRHDPARPGSLCSDDVLALGSDPAGRLWIGTHSCLDVLEPGATSFRHVDLSATGSARVLVTMLAAGQDGTIWVSTAGSGVLELPPDGPPVAHRSAPALRTSLPGNEVVALALDGDELWVTTWGSGAAHARVRGGLPMPPRPSGIEQEEDDATSVAAAPDGTLWFGSFGGGLLRVAPDGRRTRFFDQPTGGKQGGVLVVRRDRSGAIWAGSMDGVRRLDPVTGRVQRWAHVPGDAGTIGPGYVTTFLEDRQGRRWVGVGGSGLHRLDAEGRVVARLSVDTPAPGRLADGYVTALLEDAAGTIWIGTRGGLHALDPATGAVTVHAAAPRTPGALPHPTVTTLLIDRRGRLWVGTAGGGLAMLVPAGPGAPARFEHVTSADGLIGDDVAGLVEDDDGSLWVATRTGLTRYDPEAGAFASFDAADGLRSAEFNNGAAGRGRGSIFLGTPHGFLELPRGTPFPEASPSRTIITAIRTAAGEVSAAQPAWGLDRLEVRHGGWLAFEFAVLDHRVAHRHRYAYRLGDGEPWVELGAQRQVTFASLEPGTYRLSVRGRDGRGAWSTAEPALALTVVPPFWRTWTFRLLGAAALLALALAWHRLRLRALERRNRELLALREQREAAYERLRELTRHLEAVREDERRWIARELHDEMGQELTAAKIQLQLMGQAAAAGTSPARLRDALALIDQLIARVRSLSLDLRPALLDERGLKAALEGWMEAVGRRSGVAVRLELDGPAGRLPPEVEITVFRVVQESVTNALRHAAASGLRVAVREEAGALRVTVQDDGAGFDVAEALRRSSGGAHLGLAGMRERVEMLGGALEVTSGAGRGTLVSARVPVGPAAPAAAGASP